MNKTPIKIKILGGPRDGLVGKFYPGELSKCIDPPPDPAAIFDQLQFDSIDFENHKYKVVERDTVNRVITVSYYEQHD